MSLLRLLKVQFATLANFSIKLKGDSGGDVCEQLPLYCVCFSPVDPLPLGHYSLSCFRSFLWEEMYTKTG